jgi:hypothetical protein
MVALCIKLDVLTNTVSGLFEHLHSFYFDFPVALRHRNGSPGFNDVSTVRKCTQAPITVVIRSFKYNICSGWRSRRTPMPSPAASSHGS